MEKIVAGEGLELQRSYDGESMFTELSMERELTDCIREELQAIHRLLRRLVLVVEIVVVVAVVFGCVGMLAAW
jgi:hypothetical protein